ncbi:MAG: hypothetical protein MUO54_10670 [Anaerolineales bacterium]|nr:hypothetical protein [Anaerolineales bacterium]
MSDNTVYWRGWAEKQLASYQQNQGSSNHCGKFAAATTLNMLYGGSLTGEMLVEWLNMSFLKGTPRYTVFGNSNGSFIFQTANMVRKLGRLNGLYPDVKIKRGDSQTLKNNLKLGNVLLIVSVTYFQDKEPVIALGESSSSSLGATRLVGGHLMVLGAFDPQHKNEAGNPTPWGFLSSWPSKENLYWVSEDDFKRSWGRLSLFNMVIVTRGV